VSIEQTFQECNDACAAEADDGRRGRLCRPIDCFNSGGTFTNGQCNHAETNCHDSTVVGFCQSGPDAGQLCSTNDECAGGAKCDPGPAGSTDCGPARGGLRCTSSPSPAMISESTARWPGVALGAASALVVGAAQLPGIRTALAEAHHRRVMAVCLGMVALAVGERASAVEAVDRVDTVDPADRRPASRGARVVALLERLLDRHADAVRGAVGDDAVQGGRGELASQLFQRVTVPSDAQGFLGGIRAVERSVRDDLTADLEAAAAFDDRHHGEVPAAGLLHAGALLPEPRGPADFDPALIIGREHAAGGRVAGVGGADVVVVAGDGREHAAGGRLQVSVVHALLSLQVMGREHAPRRRLHVSVVHALLSLQVIGVNTHPVAGLQVSVVHALLSLQVMGVNTQPVAGLQVSVVHALLSLQVIGVNTHPVTGLQVSVVHALLSLQVMGVNTQPVAGLQVSVVHALLSLQVMGVKTHPVAGLQVSVVQALLSLQVIGVLEQMPVPWSHTSVVHALLSSQTGQRKMKPVWDEPETPPLEQVASATVGSNPRTCSIRLTVPVPAGRCHRGPATWPGT